MKQIITTTLGDFDVYMSYIPSPDDNILNRLANAIDSTLAKGEASEAILEKALFDATRAGEGAGQRVSLSLKEMEIFLRNW